MKEKITVTDYDGTNFLRDQADIDAYLAVAFDSGDSKLIARALGNVAKAKNLSETARKTGLTRAGLYRSLSEEGDPKISTFFKVVEALGYKLTPQSIV